MMITNYKIAVMYDGRQYHGWQKQGNTDKTIQGKIEELLHRMLGYEVEIHGAGRTDAGVHAIAQVFNVKLNDELSTDKLKDDMNEYLPNDIAITSVEIVDNRFHARLSAKSKTYRYRIYVGKEKPVFDRHYVHISEEHLDMDRMKQAASLLCGTHDYKSFCANKHMKKSTVRTVTSIDIYKNNDEIVIDYTGDGFLYNMVRIMSATLMDVGSGKRNPEDMKDILEGKDRALAGGVAPAGGLTLVRVEY